MSTGNNLKDCFIHFEDMTCATANKAAIELELLLRKKINEDIEINIINDNETNMDLGSILVLVFESGIAKNVLEGVINGILNYIRKSGNSVVIETPNGKVTVTGEMCNSVSVSDLLSKLI